MLASVRGASDRRRRWFYSSAANVWQTRQLSADQRDNRSPTAAHCPCSSNLMVVTHSQETCTSRLVQETWPSDMVSHTRFFLHKFLAPNTAQLYSIQETCMHVIRMVSSDWSAPYRCHCFHFVVDNLLYKVNIVTCVFLYKNLYELAQKFDTRNLHKKLVQVSWLCVTTITAVTTHTCNSGSSNSEWMYVSTPFTLNTESCFPWLSSTIKSSGYWTSQIFTQIYYITLCGRLAQLVTSLVTSTKLINARHG